MCAKLGSIATVLILGDLYDLSSRTMHTVAIWCQYDALREASYWSGFYIVDFLLQLCPILEEEFPIQDEKGIYRTSIRLIQSFWHKQNVFCCFLFLVYVYPL